MPVLGVVACEILDQEFAYLISNDPEVQAATVVDEAAAQGFLENLEGLGGCPIRRIPILKDFSPLYQGQLQVLVRFLKLGLHSHKRSLQEGVVTAARNMAGRVDGIVLGYGLCGNALQNISELLEDVPVPIHLPMDEGHPVDDCVGMIIGGRQAYYSEQCREAGTFFMIPGWTRYWDRIFDEEFGKWDVQLAKRVFRHYTRSLLLPTAVTTEEEMRRNIEVFNDLFDVRTECKSGTLRILQRTWDEAKEDLR